MMRAFDFRLPGRDDGRALPPQSVPCAQSLCSLRIELNLDIACPVVMQLRIGRTLYAYYAWASSRSVDGSSEHWSP